MSRSDLQYLSLWEPKKRAQALLFIACVISPFLLQVGRCTVVTSFAKEPSITMPPQSVCHRAHLLLVINVFVSSTKAFCCDPSFVLTKTHRCDFVLLVSLEHPKSSIQGAAVTDYEFDTSDASISRRSFALTIPFLSFPLYRSSARAVVVTAPTKVFTAGQAMGSEDARARFVTAQKDLQYLSENYDDIVKNGGGDNVRRYLGTVGFTSGMYGISKVMKELQKEAKDIVEYTENMNEFDAALRGADTACYSANFVEFSAAKTRPEAFFDDARVEIEQMLQIMKTMAAEVNLSIIILMV